MGRTGLILRQWVERDGYKVTAYQAESYETPKIMTCVVDELRVFIFPDEEQAMLCETQMNRHDWKLREKYWKHYFNSHVNPPVAIPNFNLWFLLSPTSVFTLLAILIVLASYLLK